MTPPRTKIYMLWRLFTALIFVFLDTVLNG